MASRSTKRAPSPGLIPNPLVKKRNLQWTLQPPSSPARSDDPEEARPTSAAVDSGEAVITDHLAHFTAHLSSRIASFPAPLLSIPCYAELYASNADKLHGAHFVVHQHDHPVAGPHYDLRLQINGASSVSWAVMYGLPGDPNSKRLNRNATETRVHSLWNHLVETASPQTGSLLIWDTGTYSILPRRSKHTPREDPSSPPDSLATDDTTPTQQTLLEAAFHNRKIRLRLHGSRLPDPYVLNLRLTKSEDASGRAKSLRSPRTRRRRRVAQAALPETSESEGEASQDVEGAQSVEDDGHGTHVVSAEKEADSAADVSAMERELREVEDEQVRRTNAYPGATNSIGSVHQRRWYLSLDRPACGFVEEKRGGRTIWDVPDPTGKNVDEAGSSRPAPGPREPARLQFPFHVGGPDAERSVVTGRRGEDVLRHEGVTGFVRRMGWAPVMN